MPATAARADPSPKVRLMIRLTFTPINAAARSLKATARIAMPARVCCTMNHIPPSSPAVTSSVATSLLSTVNAPR